MIDENHKLKTCNAKCNAFIFNLETVYTFAFKEHGYNCKLRLGKTDVLYYIIHNENKIALPCNLFMAFNAEVCAGEIVASK